MRFPSVLITLCLGILSTWFLWACFSFAPSMKTCWWIYCSGLAVTNSMEIICEEKKVMRDCMSRGFWTWYMTRLNISSCLSFYMVIKSHLFTATDARSSASLCLSFYKVANLIALQLLTLLPPSWAIFWFFFFFTK